MLVIILSLFISANSYAHKVLYNVNGSQELVNLSPSGSVSPIAEILWDESIHGPLPSLPGPVGILEAFIDTDGLRKIRKSSSLESAKTAADAQKQSERDAIAALKAKVNDDTATLQDLRRLIKRLLRQLGD
jgi:hypothetical protein